MSKKLKPCQNTHCICFVVAENSCIGKITSKKICQLYQPNRPESAWEMFRRLESKDAFSFHRELYKKLFPDQLFGIPNQYEIHCDLAGKLLLCSEQEATKMMLEIERDIEERS